MLGSGSSSKLIYLESLRGLAAIFVVFSHLLVVFYPEVHDDPLHAPAPLRAIAVAAVLFSGTYCVRLFFFLSGFVLSISYFRKQQISILESAAIKRYPRLMFPVLASILFAWLIQETFGYHCMDLVNFEHRSANDWLRVLYTHDVGFLSALRQGVFDAFFDQTADKSLNVVLWTMSIELAGSFFVFSFLALVGRQPKRLIIYILGASLSHFLNLPYMLDFLIGMALADFFIIMEKSQRRMALPLTLSVVMLGVGIILGDLAGAIQDGQLSIYLPSVFNIPTLASLLIVSAALFCARTQVLLEHSALAFLGKISFPLYLFHFPIMCSFGFGLYLYLRLAHFSHDFATGFTSLFVIVSSLLVAWGVYYLIELPSIKASNRLSGFFIKK